MGRKKSQTVGYRYFVGVHFVLCHGPIDRILQIKVDDRLVWNAVADNEGTGAVGGYERVHVNQPNIFGGDDREGGVSGDLDIGMGTPTQGKNDYIQSALPGKLIPANRGVVSAILRKMYVGNSPYLKPWKFRVQRIWAPTATGKPQWQPSTAGIGKPTDTFPLYSQSLRPWIAPALPSVSIGSKVITMPGAINDAGGGESSRYFRVSILDTVTGEFTYPELTNSATPVPQASINNRHNGIMDVAVYGTKVAAGIYYTGSSAFVLELDFALSWERPAVRMIPVVNAVETRFAQAMGSRLYLGGGVASADLVIYDLGTGLVEYPSWGQNMYTKSGNVAFPEVAIGAADGMIILAHAFSVIINGKLSNWIGFLQIEPGAQRVKSAGSALIGSMPGQCGYPTMAAFSSTHILLLWPPIGDSNQPGRFWNMTRGMSTWDFDTEITDLNAPSWYASEPSIRPSPTSPYIQWLGRGVEASDGRWYFPPDHARGHMVAVVPNGGHPQVEVDPFGIRLRSATPLTGPDVGITRGYMVGSRETNGRIFFRTANTPGFHGDGAASDPWHGRLLIINTAFRSAVLSTSLEVGPWDMNPAHIIRECMTNTEWGRGLPDSIIGPTYTSVAQTLYAERLGLSMLWTSEMAVNDFILEVVRHIDAVRYEDPETGLQEIKLIRPDYDVATLPVLSPSNCRIEQLTSPTLYDLVNQVTIEYWDREKGEDSAIAVQDTASINMSGTVNNQTMQYSGICSAEVALLVGQRDLARYSKPFRQGRLIVNRKVANIKPGEPFILNWPARGVTQMVCRAAKRSDNGELDGMIGIEFGEDIFSAPFNVANVPPPSGWEDPIKPPVNFDYVTMFDLPYPLLVEELGETEIAAVPAAAGYAGFAGGRPLTGSHMNYGLFLYAAGSTPPTDSQVELVNSFTPVAVLGEAIQEITDPVITVAVSPTTDMVNVRAGDWVIVGTAADPVREMMCVAEDPGASPVALKLTRAVADTYPRAVPAGTPLFVVGTFFGTDQVERVDGEDVAGYGRPKNGKGSYAGPYTYLEAEMVARQGRPYPAAAFKVDGVFTPSLTEDKKVVELTWAHRHRVQQSNQAVSWLASGNVGPETGVTYQVQQVALDEQQAKISDLPVLQVGAVDHLALDLMDQPYPDAARYARISVEAVRGGIVSLQNRPVTVKLAPRLFAPTDLRAEYVPLPRLVAPDHLRADYLPGSAPLLAPNSLRADYVSGKVALLAPDHLSAVFDSGKVELVAPDHLRAVYTGPGKLVAPDHLAAQYVGQAKLVAPDHLVARYVPASAPLYEPNGLRAIYVGPGKLAAPDNLVARYVGQGKLVAPSGLRASFVPATVPLYEPSSLRAVYVGPGKLVAPDHLAAQYVGLVKLLAPTGLTAEFVPATPPFYEPSDLRAQYVGLAKLVAPSDLAAQYEGVHVLNSPDMLRADYLGIPKLAAPTGLKADYI